MRRYLLVALLPTGLSVIAAATALVARRASATKIPVAAGRTALPDVVEELGRDVLRSAVAAIERKPAAGTSAKSEILPGLVRLGALTGAGGLVAYNIMARLGPPIVEHGLAIDEPVFTWTESHKVDWWTKGVARFNSIGNTWSTWGAVASAAVCLSISWHRQRWLPPAALGAAILVDYLSTHRLHRTIKRPGPPTSPEGTYPSGGTDRVVLFYGLIAYLLWAEFSGSHPGRVWTIGSVSGLAFLTAYCRQYLGEHWFIDIVCGVVYGGMLLAPIVVAVEQITGRANRSVTAPA
jgi:membrane-associated phospholipid phosphatase